MAPTGFGRGTLSANGMFGRSSPFPNPWMDIASTYMPDDMPNTLLWCEYLVNQCGTYRQAIDRIVSYFLTSIEVVTTPDAPTDPMEKRKWEEYLNETFNMRPIIRASMSDYLTYGISLLSVRKKFHRHATCPSCLSEVPLFRVWENGSRHQWSDFRLHATCPICSNRGVWTIVDRPRNDEEAINIRRWNPHHIDIKYDEDSGDRRFYWRIPEDDRELIRRGNLFDVERIDTEVLGCIAAQDNMEFTDKEVYCMVEEPPAGYQMRGWGLPRPLSNFRDCYHLQVLKRANEAVCLTRIVPHQIITPAARGGEQGGTDPVFTHDMGRFVKAMEQSLRRHRQDPGRVQALPFPIEQVLLGGDGTAIAPKDLLDLASRDLLTSIGMPVDMFQGSMTVNATPASMRMMEANFTDLVRHVNRFLNWAVDRIAKILNWNTVKVRLKPVAYADDLNRQMAQLQLMTSGMISKTTGLGSLGLDVYDEDEKKLNEEQNLAERQKKKQKEMEQAEAADQLVPPAGAAPPPPPGGDPAAAGAAPPGAPPPPPGAPPPPNGAWPPGGPPPPTPAGGAGMPPTAPTGPPAASQAFGAAAPLPSSVPQTPESMMAQANTLAQQLIAMPDSQKTSQLIQLKNQDPTMHALVKSILDGITRDAERQGKDMVLAQQYGKQGSYRGTERPRNVQVVRPPVRMPTTRSQQYIEF